MSIPTHYVPTRVVSKIVSASNFEVYIRVGMTDYRWADEQDILIRHLQQSDDLFVYGPVTRTDENGEQTYKATKDWKRVADWLGIKY